MVVAALAAAVLVTVPSLGQIQPGAGQKLARVSADGKVEQFDGLVELYAIQKAENVPAETRQKIEPLIRNWLLDIQQQVIDNIDFVVEIEPLDGKVGFFETFDPANPKSVERIGSFSRQLTSAGLLLNMLEFRRALDSNQVAVLRQRVYEYDFAILQELMAVSKDHMTQLRHQYRVSYRDALYMYHRLLDKAAGTIDESISAAKLTAEQAAGAANEVAAVKAAKEPKEARAAVKALFAKLTFPQRRAFLLKVRDLNPIENPFSVL